jgi:hypothetical protein
LIKNLPPDVPASVMAKRIRNVFEKLFNDSKIVHVKVLLKLDDLYNNAI